MPPDRNERVRQRAYEIWEREGRPHGRDEEHWRMAVDELAEEFSDARITADAPAAGMAKPGVSSVEEQPPTPARGGGDPPRPAAQADPLGLARPSGEVATARRGPAKPRGGPSRKSGNSAPGDPNRPH